MEEGVHYIGYDGSKEDLVAKIEFWLKPENEIKLSEIAQNGCEFIKNNFKNEIIAERLLNEISTLN